MVSVTAGTAWLGTEWRGTAWLSWQDKAGGAWPGEVWHGRARFGVARPGRDISVSQHLERCVRHFIAQGAGLDGENVRPGNAKGPRPKDPYASLLLQTDQRRSYPEHREICNAAGLLTGTLLIEPRRATYSLQFYRDGAVELAERFDRWAQSEVGLLQALTSFASGGGSLRRIRVLQGGSGYDEAVPPAVMIRGLYGAGRDAAATAGVVGGAVSGLPLDHPGKDYIDVLQPVDPAVPEGAMTSGITIADPPTPGGETATASAIGWGHSVVFPLEIRRLDTILGDAFEERTQIDLSIDYTAWDTDAVADTGAITDWDLSVFATAAEPDFTIDTTA